jgi:hypothetical protein
VFELVLESALVLVLESVLVLVLEWELESVPELALMLVLELALVLAREVLRYCNIGPGIQATKMSRIVQLEPNTCKDCHSQ